jgi:hypothetical protein
MHRISVIDNFITKEDADTLIREQHNPSEVNPYPEYYGKRYGGTSLPYNKNVMEINQTKFIDPIMVFLIPYMCLKVLDHTG